MSMTRDHETFHTTLSRNFYIDCEIVLQSTDQSITSSHREVMAKRFLTSSDTLELAQLTDD